MEVGQRRRFPIGRLGRRFGGGFGRFLRLLFLQMENTERIIDSGR